MIDNLRIVRDEFGAYLTLCDGPLTHQHYVPRPLLKALHSALSDAATEWARDDARRKRMSDAEKRAEAMERLRRAFDLAPCNLDPMELGRVVRAWSASEILAHAHQGGLQLGGFSDWDKLALEFRKGLAK